SFYNPEITPWIIGGILALVIFYCLVGGGKRIVSLSSAIVPFKGGIYILVAIIITIMNVDLLPNVLSRIFTEAFDFQAIFGGFAGSCMMQGIKRGLFSNEAGVGSAPNAAAAADVSHPVKQGLVQMLSVFIDTILICTATALMCLCSGVEPTAEAAGAPYVQTALQASLGSIGPIFITVAMVLFAFTTLIGNFYYVDNLLIYIMKKVPSKQFMLGFRIVASLLIFIGAGLSMGLVWDIADVLMGIMAIINIPVIIILGKPAMGALTDYVAQRKAGKNPAFKAESVGLKGKTDYWQ
ncbi:MAG: alanine:cation symporter family protein, partial [Oscillibacter sp.]|nr:alanine:cation symporter family protein [Oscillibacter sp.]